MQRYTIFFIAVNAVHVSGSFSTHRQEPKLYTQHLACAVTANSSTLAVAASKPDTCQMLCVQFELLMMGGKIA